MQDLTQTQNCDSLRGAREANWPGKPVAWGLRLLALIALAGTVYLAAVHWQHGAAGCGSSQLGCKHVLNSPWARWLGLPISYPAVGVYTLILVTSFLSGPHTSGFVRRVARFTLVMLATMAAGAAFWFLTLLVFVLGKLCIFCLIVHSCGLIIGLIILIHPPIHRPRYGRQWLRTLRRSMGMPGGKAVKRPDYALTSQAVVVAVCLGLLSVSGLILGQLLLPSRPPRVLHQSSLSSPCSTAPFSLIRARVPPAPTDQGLDRPIMSTQNTHFTHLLDVGGFPP